MGNNVKGRTKPKPKSVKAAMSHDVGSKRKLSRMGKKQKKGRGTLEATYIGRSKCIKMLQLTIKDFRRLCILKGIYPREPHGRVPGNKKGQTYYHIKDIKAISHEPILQKFREFRAFMKKVRRAAGRNEPDEAQRKNALLPQYTLHHLVKERYPRFIDALNDLDDALTLTYLFAALPSRADVPSAVIQKAKTVAAAWGSYCATTSCLSKSFISVKGVYLEANIASGGAEPATVRWVVPHAFTQFMPTDVDFRVMRTFLEFYDTLLNFVLYKLYSDIGVRYPLPMKDVAISDKSHFQTGSTSAVLARTLRALMQGLESSEGAVSQVVTSAVEGTSSQNKETTESTSKSTSKESSKRDKELIKSVDAVLNNLDSDDGDENNDDEEDDVDVAGPLRAALDNVAEQEARGAVPSNANDDTMARRRLFQGLTFFFSREIPRGYLELVCLAYGGKVGWEGDEENSPIDIKDPSITHHIVDRPRLPASYADSLPKSREFIQPQWVLDSANFMIRLPIQKYSLGAELPPHLSPWVNHEEEGYKPAYAEEIERLKNGEPMLASEDEASVKNDEDNDEKMEDSTEKDKEEAKEAESEDDDDEDDDEEEEEEEETNQKKTQEKQEQAAKREAKRRKREQEKRDEEHAMAKSMMSRKAKHLYNRMQYGIANKQAKVDELHKRRQEIESSRKKDKDGKTVLKQKVERLKKERKTLEDQYGATPGTMKRSQKKQRKSK